MTESPQFLYEKLSIFVASISCQSRTRFLFRMESDPFGRVHALGARRVFLHIFLLIFLHKSPQADSGKESHEPPSKGAAVSRQRLQFAVPLPGTWRVKFLALISPYPESLPLLTSPAASARPRYHLALGALASFFRLFLRFFCRLSF